MRTNTPKTLLSPFRAPLSAWEDVQALMVEHDILYSHVMLEALALWLMSHKQGRIFDDPDMRTHLDRVMCRIEALDPSAKLATFDPEI